MEKQTLLYVIGGAIAVAAVLSFVWGHAGRGSTPAQTAWATSDQVIQVDLAANDIVYDPFSDKIYVSVPSTAGAVGNSITVLDPHTGEVGSSVFVGSEPGNMAISDDGQYIYVALDGAAAVRRFDVASQTAGLQFLLGSDLYDGPLFVEDIEVLPGNPEAVAVSRRNACCSPRHEGVAIYDDGIQRPTKTGGHTGSNVIEFSDSASTLYGYNNESTEFGLRRMAVDASGVSVLDVTRDLVRNFGVDIRFDGGLIYTTTGRVVDPDTLTLVGTYAASGPVQPDSTAGRAFFLTGSGSTRTILAFDQSTFTLIGSLEIPGVSGGASLIRWGEDGLAFRTGDDQIFLIQTSLVQGAPKPTATPTPTPTATPTALPGDVNCDAEVSSVDAALILQYDGLLIEVLACPQNADVDEDGTVNAVDAALILQFDAGLIGSLTLP